MGWEVWPDRKCVPKTLARYTPLFDPAEQLLDAAADIARLGIALGHGVGGIPLAA